MIAVSAIMLFSGCASRDPASDGTSDENAQNTDAGSDTAKPMIHGSSVDTALSQEIYLDPAWEYADLAVIGSGCSVLYRGDPSENKKVIAINAGHGTAGGESERVYCHPDKTPKVTHGSNPKGSLKAVAVSAGMIFKNGETEAEVAMKVSDMLRTKLLDAGYDVLMIRDEADVQLDNVARTVIANNNAHCLVSIHFDGDGLNYDKGCFYIPVPDEIKQMDPVAKNWREHDRLGKTLVDALRANKCSIYDGRIDALELTQTCYATVPAAVVELGNAQSDISDEALEKYADGLLAGIETYMNEEADKK